MVATILPNIWRTSWNWSANSLIAQNVLCFQSSTTDPTALHAQITSAVTGGMWGGVVSSARIFNIDYLKLDGSTASQRLSCVGAQWAGTGGTDGDPAVAIKVKFSTGFRGKAGQGGIRIPFTDSALTTAGSLQGPTVTTMDAAWDGFLAAMQGANSPLQIVHFLPKEPVPGDVASNHTVTAVAVQPILSTQRSRQDQLRG